MTTTIDTTASNAPSAGTGLACVAEWLTTTDHKRIGRLYIVGGALAFLGAAVVAVLLGVERTSATSELFEINALSQLFAVERFGFTYLGLAPLMIGIALAVVPLQLGARSLAFPRVAAAGFWLWLVGAALAIYSIINNGGPNGGNTRFVELFNLSALLVIAGLVAGVVCLATSVLTTRAPGMNMRRIPFFSWSVLIASLALLIALPVVAGDLLFSWLAYRYPSPDNLLSGSQAINDWVGFGFSQPTTLLFVIPVFGFFAETVATATGQRLRPRGVLFGAIGLAGIAVLATVVQAPVTLRPAFSALNLGDKLADLVPFALVHGLPLLGAFVAFALVAKNLATRPKLQSPLVFAFLAALLALSAAAASALLHVGDAELAGTTFEEGNWLAVVFAGVLAAMGAVVYWGPKWWGREMPTRPMLELAVLTFLGAELASLPLLVAGFADQPSAVFPALSANSNAVVNFAYGGNPSLWNTLSAVGLGLVALAVLAFVAVAVRALRGEANAAIDPWNGQTLEWAAASPAPADNFPVVHIVSSAEPLLDLRVAERSSS
ncbi:MAG: cbb3-type cytochrome c oxidase subunit I [Actinomycetia bacterium]|nr:cbb3-type cytochrome c oxidase subunit I [Actinomycetes bacterium]